MTDENQTDFDFDSLATESILSVQDFSKGDIITVRKTDDGKCLERQHVQGTKKDSGEEYDFYQNVLFITYEGEKTAMRVNNTEAKKLGQVCAKKQENLEGKKFKIEFVKNGGYKAIALVLTT